MGQEGRNEIEWSFTKERAVLIWHKKSVIVNRCLFVLILLVSWKKTSQHFTNLLPEAKVWEDEEEAISKNGE